MPGVDFCSRSARWERTGDLPDEVVADVLVGLGHVCGLAVGSLAGRLGHDCGICIGGLVGRMSFLQCSQPKVLSWYI